MEDRSQEFNDDYSIGNSIKNVQYLIHYKLSTAAGYLNMVYRLRHDVHGCIWVKCCVVST